MIFRVNTCIDRQKANHWSSTTAILQRTVDFYSFFYPQYRLFDHWWQAVNTLNLYVLFATNMFSKMWFIGIGWHAVYARGNICGPTFVWILNKSMAHRYAPQNTIYDAATYIPIGRLLCRQYTRGWWCVDDMMYDSDYFIGLSTHKNRTVNARRSDDVCVYRLISAKINRASNCWVLQVVCKAYMYAEKLWFIWEDWNWGVWIINCDI